MEKSQAGSGFAAADRAEGVVAEEAIRTFEAAHPDGVTSAQTIAFFQDRGVRLSEATFRRYVQLGLLPRCRRVGRKGRHQGSQGVYPVAVLRRLNEVKGLLDRERSIEEIRSAFRVREDDLQEIRQRIERVLRAIDEHLAEVPDPGLARRLARLREVAAELDSQLRAAAADVARGRDAGRMAV
jgi:DNA-binding transcriptional MerR regulator